MPWVHSVYSGACFPSLCAWNSVPSCTALCPCVTCPEIISCLQPVTFNLASFLELQSLIVFVLSSRFVLPSCPKVLIYNYPCGRAVRTYTSPKRWTWSYHLVCEHCRLAKRRFQRSWALTSNSHSQEQLLFAKTALEIWWPWELHVTSPALGAHCRNVVDFPMHSGGSGSLTGNLIKLYLRKSVSFFAWRALWFCCPR